MAKDHHAITMNLITHTMSMYKTKKKNVFIDNKENMIHSLKKKQQQNNWKQIKIARISYPKLLFWRLLSQQFGRAER